MLQTLVTSFRSLRSAGFGYAVLSLLLMLAAGCGQEADLPEPSTEAYRETVTSFYVGVASVQSGQDRLARDRFTDVTELAPGEPAGWGNLGLLALRQRELDEAAEYLERARALATKSDHIQMLLGHLAGNRGQYQEAIEHYRRAISFSPRNLKARYALSRVLEQQSGGEPPLEVQQLLEEIHQADSSNLAVRIEWARVAAERGDLETLRTVVEMLEGQTSSWPPGAREQFAQLQQSIAAGDVQSTVRQLAFLKNILKQLPAYRQGLAAIETPAAQVGELITEFLRLSAPETSPAPPDTALTFVEEIVTLPEGNWSWIGVLPLQEGHLPGVVAADEETVRIRDGQELPFPGGDAAPTSAANFAAVDVNYDFIMDLALAGRGGFRLFRQDSTGGFHEITPEAGLSRATREGAYHGVWSADVDMEGDMDLILARPDAAPLVLRNNGDGSFDVLELFQDVRGLQDFTWADVDGDGDPDAGIVGSSGRLSIYLNQRSGNFRRLELPPGLETARAVDAADITSDGTIDLIVLDTNGSVKILSRDLSSDTWNVSTAAEWPGSEASLADVSVRLFIDDLDNNGELDLAVAVDDQTRIWLGNGDGGFQLLSHTVGADVSSAAELTGDGRLDFVGLGPEGEPLRLVSRGELQYGWYIARPRAARATGDQRINSFGIGGEIEMRAGLLYQKQIISSPQVHFGLGTHESAELMRIIWPNGSIQAEFDLTANEALRASQRLKGSCPWLFTYDGSKMRFVKDFIWRSGLGIRINAQETAGIMQTLDRVKIPGEFMAPKNGYYDVRVTAELWETHFFDHVSLEVIDHPEETEVFIDERFVPRVDLSVQSVSQLHDVAGAYTGDGREVTETVRERDGDYLGGFAMTAYQGSAEDHYVEIDLGDSAPSSGPLWLIAHGWLYPTDSSINIALSQGSHPSPSGLRMEVPDGNGGWKQVNGNLGFPAGKLKTVLLDLEDVFVPGTERRLRLYTTAEIYWDQIAWAQEPETADVRVHEVAADTARLRYRGFSHVTTDGPYAPEVPHYDTIVGTAPRWRDLVGYYTRFGPVGELLRGIDDRYVIMNAGDEMIFRFKAPPPPPEGWTRDFVLVGDGWVKDGDYNTKLSKTVRPLPYHGQDGYTGPVGPLSEDPVYKQYPEDWRIYHTRYVGTDGLQQAIAKVR